LRRSYLDFFFFPILHHRQNRSSHSTTFPLTRPWRHRRRVSCHTWLECTTQGGREKDTPGMSPRALRKMAPPSRSMVYVKLRNLGFSNNPDRTKNVATQSSLRSGRALSYTRGTGSDSEPHERVVEKTLDSVTPSEGCQNSTAAGACQRILST